jgi:hypothetical protein
VVLRVFGMTFFCLHLFFLPIVCFYYVRFITQISNGGVW